MYFYRTVRFIFVTPTKSHVFRSMTILAAIKDHLITDRLFDGNVKNRCREKMNALKMLSGTF